MAFRHTPKKVGTLRPGRQMAWIAPRRGVGPWDRFAFSTRNVVEHKAQNAPTRNGGGWMGKTPDHGFMCQNVWPGRASQGGTL